ncbi:MAG: hypothetical protein A2603_00255 [Bdellovibrionales bacterium RIFOXYD1_FULL_55_31]|nr:MAG: hypothetical protein A2603_00255 [Bdellovibrionales bacterium RIFOXYD1_FULL_55_31]
MGRWSKIDWYCPDCGEYWMTTENCSPGCCLKSDCECPDAQTLVAISKCHHCGQDLQNGSDLCYHFDSRSQAV